MFTPSLKVPEPPAVWWLDDCGSPGGTVPGWQPGEMSRLSAAHLPEPLPLAPEDQSRGSPWTAPLASSGSPHEPPTAESQNGALGVSRYKSHLGLKHLLVPVSPSIPHGPGALGPDWTFGLVGPPVDFLLALAPGSWQTLIRL